MYGRDKNHPSITMWSLGNESGGYKCQDVCYEYLKNANPEIPVHYEVQSAVSAGHMMLCQECTAHLI